MKTCWQQTGEEDETPPPGAVDENLDNAARPTDKQARQKKRRKLMKGFKKYTGVADKGERKFKGWSCNGQKAFEKWTREITADADNGMYTMWEKAYREVEQKLRVKPAAASVEVEKFQADRSVVWNLPNL